MENTSKKNKTAGRPSAVITWPSSPEFLVSDVESLNPNVKKVTIQGHITKNVKSKILEISGKAAKEGRGSKPNIYKFTAPKNISK